MDPCIYDRELFGKGRLAITIFGLAHHLYIVYYLFKKSCLFICNKLIYEMDIYMYLEIPYVT